MQNSRSLQVSNEKSALVKLQEEFNYAFNRDGQLRDSEDNPFLFEFHELRADNQRRYDRIGEILDEYVYDLLVERLHLQRLPVPVGSSETAGTFIFASEGALASDKLLILIHGSGVVRAGQWARSMILQESLEKGTQMPYIRRAVDNGFGVLVLNTNDNTRLKKRIKGSNSPEDHAINVWKHYVEPSAAKHIAIVGHSYGGSIAITLLQSFESEFLSRVFAIALIDSVHALRKTATEEVRSYFSKVTKNWVISSLPLGAWVGDTDCACLSAGTSVHNETPWASKEEVFRFIKERLQDELDQKPA